jgi:two-component sensor histidine kinase
MKSWILLLLLMLPSFASWAEPFYPLLNKVEADSLKAQLWQTPPSITRVKLLLQISTNITFSRGFSLDFQMDSTSAYIKQARILSETLHYPAGQIESDYLLGLSLMDSNQKKAAQQKIQQALALSCQQHNLYLEGLGWHYLVLTFEGSSTEELEALRCYTRAIQCYQLLRKRDEEAYMRKEMADVHLRQGEQAVARAELLQVIALYRACGHHRLHYAFDLLAGATEALGNYKEALQYSLASIKSAKETRDTVFLSMFYHRMDGIYKELNQQEKCIEYNQLALQSAHNTHYRAFLCADIVLSISQNLIALGRSKQALTQVLKERRDFPSPDKHTQVLLTEGLTNCYLVLKQYTLATEYGQQLLRLVGTKEYVGDYRQQTRTYLLLGKLYVATRQYDKARPYINKALTLNKLLGFRGPIARTYLLLFKVDSAQGKLMDAIISYQRYKALNDNIFSEKNSKEVAGLQIQYDTEKQAQNIALLTKRNQMQHMTIRQQKFQRNAFFVGAVLLVLVLGLGYNRYRLGQRSNRLLEEKQQLLEAQQAEISQKNQSLEHIVSEKEILLTEKEWMLKEIHHRVKNNLQVISSLLTNQSNYLRDPLASAAIRESRNRVQAMALIHQRLYQTDTLARVNMAAYVREIVNSLLESFDRFDTVTTQLNVAAVELEIALATPLGLIVNEAVTNVLKYAFPSAGRGTLTITLNERPAHHYQLTIADDGVGLPPDFDLDQSHSLGLTIIKGLSTQIGGDLRIESANGVRVSLQFEAAKSVVPVG